MHKYVNDAGMTVLTDLKLRWPGWREETPAGKAPAKKKAAPEPVAQEVPEEAKGSELDEDDSELEVTEPVPKGKSRK